jgi:hypothetical protein
MVIGHKERQFQTTNLLEVDSKPGFLKNKHFNKLYYFKMSLWILKY